MKSVLSGLVLLGLTACNAPGPAPVIERVQGRTPAPTVATPSESISARPAAPQIADSTNGLHTVQRGDTLYAVAFANNLDYREIASWNKLESADRILVGQVLRLTPPSGAVELKPLDEVPEPSARVLAEPPLLATPQAVLLAYSPANWAQVSGALKDSDPLRAEARAESYALKDSDPLRAEARAESYALKDSDPLRAEARAESYAPKATATPTEPKPLPAASEVKPAVVATPTPAPAAASTPVDNWLWPTEGKLIGRFGAAGGKGIDIVGQRNAPVKAVAPGKVVYSGSGLRGYGRLLIVKHPGEYLSAYAHNETILVKEGDTVAAGQRIALMGDSDADRVKLHFEIRRYGKPLDPLTYLPERS